MHECFTALETGVCHSPPHCVYRDGVINIIYGRYHDNSVRTLPPVARTDCDISRTPSDPEPGIGPKGRNCAFRCYSHALGAHASFMTDRGPDGSTCRILPVRASRLLMSVLQQGLASATGVVYDRYRRRFTRIVYYAYWNIMWLRGIVHEI